jgi:hypothetical protein
MRLRRYRVGLLGFAIGLAAGLISCGRQESAEDFEKRMAVERERAVAEGRAARAAAEEGPTR